MRSALGSCVDYAPATSPRPEVGAGELAFELDENLAEASPACEPYARELLAKRGGTMTIDFIKPTG